MLFRLCLYLAAVLVVCFSSNANADSRIADFFGSYTGFGFATDSSGPFIRTERNFELAIGPLEGGGFEIAWSTVKRKGSNPNSLVSEVSEHAEQFRPSDKPGVFFGVNNGTVFDSSPIQWARLQSDVLIVYRMEVDENGVIELHVYQRMLTAKGLELFFRATRDNIEVRSVRGRYRRQ